MHGHNKTLLLTQEDNVLSLSKPDGVAVHELCLG
jgi:hypothetical protein